MYFSLPKIIMKVSKTTLERIILFSSKYLEIYLKLESSFMFIIIPAGKFFGAPKNKK